MRPAIPHDVSFHIEALRFIGAPLLYPFLFPIE